MEDVRLINLFGKNIPVRTYGCKNICNKEPLYIETPFINIFIQTSSNCNANCKFCIYNDNERKIFNIDKLAIILKEISSIQNVDIGKLNYTGGEPTLDINLLDEIVKCSEENLDLLRKPEITLNTNGFKLSETLKYQYFIDSIGLSRHHYDDNKNAEIFKTNKVANNEEIEDFINNLQRKEIVQLRCNLIKNYVDSYSEITKYMNKAIDIGVRDCGFVTLAPNNDFCKEHQIDFKNLVSISRDLIKTNSWTRVDDKDFSKEYCQCANYVYSNPKGDMCKFYSRLFCRNDLKEGMLVYDGSNLRYGFSGEVIF